MSFAGGEVTQSKRDSSHSNVTSFHEILLDNFLLVARFLNLIVDGLIVQLLRHQEKIEDLERENAVLREQLNLNGNIRTKDTCIDCRRLSRRRN